MSLVRLPTLAFLISLEVSTPNFAQTPPNSPPLTPAELRETANNLIELKASRERLKTLEAYIQQLKDFEERERQLSAKELEAEQRLRMIAERERDIEKARGDQLEAALKLRNRKSGFGCAVKKFFTLGLGRCG